ncbi:nucleotidyltransferase domain-containing protein [Saccharolobus caldissimus]|uniref:protein adenylyltransferase n=1 Tax=Saccharolobus caldissimus TaxID=1702097 RepID=A0AAQ4CWS1_9CREN|nr:nucleotidyltransferase domain-containing protein [Saccharolobus caldissimus]BDC00253.1 DNA polymerase subunit beta [Saccharolobus caldissimus]
MQVDYSETHWKILAQKRKIAIEILRMLMSKGMEGYVYGSVARGDVNDKSDIDIVVFNPNYIILDTLEVHHKYIIQATPNSVPKAYLSLDEDEEVVISFPLGKLKRNELEFYSFGGLIDLKGLEEKKRVIGVNKNLMIIIPTENGHMELPLNGNEDYAAKLLKISVDTIRERERLLTKRADKGHTGIYLRYDLDGNESIYDAFAKIYKSNKYFRRMINA